MKTGRNIPIYIKKKSNVVGISWKDLSRLSRIYTGSCALTPPPPPLTTTPCWYLVIGRVRTSTNTYIRLLLKFFLVKMKREVKNKLI